MYAEDSLILFYQLSSEDPAASRRWNLGTSVDSHSTSDAGILSSSDPFVFSAFICYFTFASYGPEDLIFIFPILFPNRSFPRWLVE